MPDEAAGAVMDPPSTEAEIVTGTPEADAGREQQSEGTEAGQSESGKGEETTDARAAFFEGMSAEEFDHWLATAPPELKESSAALKEIAGRAEQRGRTTVEEATRQAQTRADLATELIELGAAAEAWLTSVQEEVKEKRGLLAKAISDEDFEAAAAIQAEIDEVLDNEDFGAAPKAIEKAAELRTARQHTLALREALGKYTPLLGDLTAEEKATFDAARQHDMKNGSAVAQGLLLDLIVGKAVLRGRELERGEIDGKAAKDEKLMERVDKWQEARSSITPTPNGTGGKGWRTLDDLSKARSAGTDGLSDAEFLAEQNRLMRIS